MRPLHHKHKGCEVDLSGHLNACERNYHRVLKILPGLREGRGTWRYAVGQSGQIDVSIRLLESAPYTSLVLIEQRHESLTLPVFSLRICHDADVAEIISWDGHRDWQSNYAYPNPKMYQPDEKLSLNRFLSDWLDFCLNLGMVHLGICDSVLVYNKS